MNKIPNEEDLLCQVADGNENAFVVLMGTYSDLVFSHAVSYVKSNELAEEMVQDIFLKVWTNRGQLNAVENFKAYLFILSKNHLLSFIRKKVTLMAAGCQMVEDNSVPDKQLEVKDSVRLIHKGISLLPPQQKAVFMLSRFEDLRYDQIGERLQISTGTVKFHMILALKHLRKYIRAHAIQLVLAGICSLIKNGSTGLSPNI